MAKTTIVARRNVGLVLVASILCLQLRLSQQDEAMASIYTVEVTRRSMFDIYFPNLKSSKTCDSVNRSYLVNEVKCVSDQELFSGMITLKGSLNFILFLAGCGASIPSMEPIIPIAADLTSQSSSTIYLVTTITAASRFIFNDTNQSVNSSFCQISSLEVYRGREQAIEISHQGFSLSDNGSIEVR